MTEIIELVKFPDSFKTGGLLLRIDENKFYLNTSNDEDNPAFTELGGPVPSSTVLDYAGLASTIPIGWLRCDGSAVSEVTYPLLFIAIGYTYGNPGSGNFNLPSLESENKFVSAADSDGDLGVVDGENTVTLSIAQIPSHNHSYSAPSSLNSLSYNNANNSSNVLGTTTGSTTGSAGSGSSHQNRPRNLKMYKIIKT